MRNKRMLKRVLAVTLSAAMALPAGGVMPGAEALPAQAAETTTTASEDSEVTLPTPVYHFDFEDAASEDGTTTIKSSGAQYEGTAKIVGNGVIEEDTVDKENRGKVFHNDPNLTKQLRTNYLTLPGDSLAHSQATKELTIGFWVNAANAADFSNSPMFTAFASAPVNGANSWPMLRISAKKLNQVNCSGWSDFLDADNVKRKNEEGTSWLNDKAWHFYTTTFTKDLVTVYVDGVIANQWKCDGSDGHNVSGLFREGALLKYICLGGNQAWDWKDIDPAFKFDDVVIYNQALTQEQIQSVVEEKKGQATEIKMS